ncbi:hydantoinase B/oxoprolinase family protein [SAR116 cluster bacterium]|nr:hydantoinase B/oxoprolinase family protein [SAR116 cluster bacterium]
MSEYPKSSTAPVPDHLAEIQNQVMWTRLISVVEEQAQALLRTAFGSVVREAGDLSAGVYDITGRMLAQAITGTPGHVNTMAMAVAHFIERFPTETMQPGDVFVSNDPWMGTGHLFDFVVVTPAFHQGQIVALFASTSHVTDVGGRGFTADAKSIFEEGIQIPHMYLRRAGVMSDDLIGIIAANSRNPVEVIGDIRSLISSNDVGVERLEGMMEEFELTSLDRLAVHILDSSLAATKKAIEAVPDGVYHADMTIDGYESPITLKTRLEINGDRCTLDYAGSSPESAYGINSPKCYTDAYSVFGLKCVIAPDTPNNHASLSCFDVLAETGSCVAPERPAPVTARHVIGQMLPDAVFGCLSQALGDTTPAESAGSIWVLAMSGRRPQQNPALPNSKAGNSVPGTAFNVMNVGLGGVGATKSAPGLNTTAFPSGVGSIPVEITETESPLIFRRKEYIQDSAGAGTMPGGASQLIEIANTDDAGFDVSAATWDRLNNPARGRSGGGNGSTGKARLGSGSALIGKTTHHIPNGDTLIVELPGGGGFGNPHDRPKADIIADVMAGLISRHKAREIYGLSDDDLADI